MTPVSGRPRASMDAVLGCLVGGAIGDVIGGLAERKRACLSDDTQLTLATCEAIIATRSVDPEAIAAAFVRWYRDRALVGLGSATVKALRDLDAGGHWALSGARGEMSAGNGAAMRIAPLAFVLDPRDAGDRVTVRDVCRITHHHEEAYIGALAVLLAIRDHAIGETTSLVELAAELPDSRVRDRLAELSGGPGGAPGGASVRDLAGRFGSSGWVVDTVPLALECARRMTSASFESVLHEI